MARLSLNIRQFYIPLAILNIGVGLMFAVILVPSPEPPEISVVAAPSHHEKLQPIVKPITGTAQRVVVPSVAIDVAVREGSYDSDSESWSIDTQSAFHASTTVPVNNTNGTAFIYGHAGWQIFETLPSVQKGAEATVYTAEGYRFVYEFESNRQVDPTDVSLLTEAGPPKLMLQTCSGAFDTYRTLVTFRLKGVMNGE